VHQILNYLSPGSLDAVMLNTAQPPAGARERLANDGVYPMPVSEGEIARIRSLGVTPVLGHYVETDDEQRSLWNKQDSVRHDPHKIARALVNLIQDSARQKR
jgi:hypothetical protein